MPTEGSTKEPYDLVRGIAAIDYYEGVENPTIALVVTFIDVDQRPGSSVTVAAPTASPHPLKSVAFVTVAPSECMALAVPFCALEIPVNSAPATPV